MKRKGENGKNETPKGKKLNKNIKVKRKLINQKNEHNLASENKPKEEKPKKTTWNKK